MIDKRFSRIKGVSERRRLPRLGVIRMGIKKSKGGREYPAETDYFVCPEDVQRAYGAEPKELEVVFPVNDPEVIFPQALKRYGKTHGLKCQGNGEEAIYYDEEKKAMVERKCPCEALEKRECRQVATLLFMLPKVSMGGVYQLRTGSSNSIQDINSALDFYNGLLGRINMVPFALKRVPIQVTHEGSMRTHYTLRLEFKGTPEQFMETAANTRLFLSNAPKFQIEAPDETDPRLDPVDVYEDDTPYFEPAEAEKEEEMTDEQYETVKTLMEKNGIKGQAKPKFFTFALGGKLRSKKVVQEIIDNFGLYLNEFQNAS